ncbi:hypothetical protein ACNSO8_19140 [Yersinia sp. LJYL362]|uniref:hypothetical protein n=1 Tax=Yersinia sp. LJYL362 TaxID=3402108 RepID=UPI003AB141C0
MTGGDLILLKKGQYLEWKIDDLNKESNYSNAFFNGLYNSRLWYCAPRSAGVKLTITGVSSYATSILFEKILQLTGDSTTNRNKLRHKDLLQVPVNAEIQLGGQGDGIDIYVKVEMLGAPDNYQWVDGEIILDRLEFARKF